MPTISQLPPAAQVTAYDQIPISQAGAVCAVSVGTLLSGTQPAILAATGSLLGRTSLGPGGPDAVEVGIGLLLNTETLIATGADHASFPLQDALNLSDDAVLCSEGNPKLMQLSLLRGLFSAGPNITIDSSGNISAIPAGVISGSDPTYTFSGFSTVSSISSSDLVAICQNGSDCTISYSNFLDGQTIDKTQVAASASDSDTFLVGQNSNSLSRQTLGAVWSWINSKMPSYQLPTLEITANATLSAATHNGRVLICSQPLTVTPASGEMGSGFSCQMVNASSGNVTLSTDIVTSSGNSELLPGQAANLICVTYSGGTLVYATMTGPGSILGVPGQVMDLAVNSVTATTVGLVWNAASPAATSYVVQYRVTGTATWSPAPSVIVLSCSVGALVASTSYDFVVYGSNIAGAGSPSAIFTVLTSASVGTPGQVTNVATSGATSNGITLAWSPPGSGGVTSSYTVQYRITGTSSWSIGASDLTATLYTVNNLLSDMSYDFDVLAVNASGAGPASSIATATTSSGGISVTSVTWNIVPSGSYVHGSGAIGVNAQITPSAAAVQFGFSTSSVIPPTNWTLGSYVNTNLWGAYVTTPSSPGTWYVWVEGTNGSTASVYPSGFSVT